MSLLSGDELEALAAATAGLAHQHVRFDRDETDSFRIRLQALEGREDALPTRAQLLPALPSGSGWAHAVGWRSFIVYPLDGPGISDLVLVALERVVPHPSRGAYPLLGGALIAQGDVAPVLLKLAAHLDPGSVTTPAETTYGVIGSSAASPQAYVAREAWLLCSAAATFAEGRRLLVRTLLLTEEEVPGLAAVGSPRGLLLGTVPALRDRFSIKARLILKGLLSVTIPPAGS